MLIDWKNAALEDARAILTYIAQDNLAAAYKVYEEIKRQVLILEEHPKIGRTGRVKATRELIITHTPYIVPYRIKGKVVHILRVLHGARDWPQQF